MPERLVENAAQWRDIMWFALIGLGIGIGQLMASKEELTPRIIFGRAISTAGIAMAAGAVLIWFPSVPFVGQVGVAAGLASLGTSGLEKVFQRFGG